MVFVAILKTLITFCSSQQQQHKTSLLHKLLKNILEQNVIQQFKGQRRINVVSSALSAASPLDE
jgi:ribosomal protein S25